MRSGHGGAQDRAVDPRDGRRRWHRHRRGRPVRCRRTGHRHVRPVAHGRRPVPAAADPPDPRPGRRDVLRLHRAGRTGGRLQAGGGTAGRPAAARAGTAGPQPARRHRARPGPAGRRAVVEQAIAAGQDRLAGPGSGLTRRRNVGRWRVAAGSLVPLLPAALFLLVDVGESSSVVLLVAVVVATILGGTTAGIAAVVLAGFVYDLVVLPPRFELAFPLKMLPHLVGFLAVAAGTVAVVGRLQVLSRQAERARGVAEDRARELAERVELIGPVLDAAPVGF